MEIQVLPPDVVDQIAAGEVVERPAHLVKELMENSLDAGARRIEVECAEGGRRVKVTDDGHGLSAQNLPLALERFATSKIRKSDDLWSLSTFGFRGEALASLAAVSRLTMTSRLHADEHAAKLVSEFGRRLPVEKAGGAPGTSVLVEDLFANVPARLKFLKTESGETAQIRTTFKAIAMSRPDVEFRLHENGRLQAYYPAVKTPRERVEQIFEVSPLFEGFGEREGVKAHAVFAGPDEVAKTTRQIWLFAQGRWVQDRSMQAAVIEAYRNLLMHGEYPLAAVWVTCDPSEIDVNIHPTKSQVKFRDSSLVFRAVASAVRTTLETAPWLPPAPATKGFVQAEDPAAESLSRNPVEAATLAFSDAALHATVSPRRNFFTPALETRPAPPAPETRPVTHLPNEAPLKVEAPTGVWSALEVIGQAHLTYILCQSERGLVLIDQHAAHERVAFERLMGAWKGGRIEIQDFLFPVAIDLSPDKVEALGAVADDLAKLGISMDVLGPGTVGVKSGPALLKDSVYGAALEKTAQQIVDHGGSFEFERVVGDLCATMACHSVVRAGQPLSKEQMQSLLRDMDEFPLSSFCPHGRPVSVEFPFTRLEKEFGRLV